MKYLLDTNIIINHLRGRQSIKIDFLREGSGLSIISLAELFYGAHKSYDSKNNLAKVKKMIIDLEIKIIDLDEETIDKYGQLKAQLEEKGKKIDDFDLLIAATALKNNLILVTENKDHFKRIPHLKIAKHI